MELHKLILIVLIPIGLLLNTCTCQQRLERMQRLCPECFEAVTVENTVILPGAEMGTTVPIEWQAERQALLTLPVEIDSRQGVLNIDIHDTVADVRLTVPPDTIRLCDTVSLPPRTIVKEKPAFSTIDKMLLAAILVMVVILPIRMKK